MNPFVFGIFIFAIFYLLLANAQQRDQIETLTGITMALCERSGGKVTEAAGNKTCDLTEKP